MNLALTTGANQAPAGNADVSLLDPVDKETTTVHAEFGMFNVIKHDTEVKLVFNLLQRKLDEGLLFDNVVSLLVADTEV